MLRLQRHLPALFFGLAALAAFGTERPASVPELNSAGIRALNGGEFDQALRYFKTAHQADPRNADVTFNLGLTYFRMGRYKEAAATLGPVVSTGEPAEKIRYVLGVSLYQSGDFDGAAGQLEVLHRRNSQHADEILYLLEESYRRGKKPQEAKQSFAELESQFPNSCFLHKLMGIAYGEQGREDLALAEFQQALAGNASISDVHRAIGVIYLNRRDAAEASGWFKGELALNPCDPGSHYYLGEIARGNHETAAAAAEYQKATGCDANYAEGHLGLGMVWKEQHQTGRALEEFRAAARLEPDNPQAHYELARCLQELGKIGESKVELETVQRLKASEDAKAAAKRP